jgi:putative FmdB family regulatory protein
MPIYEYVCLDCRDTFDALRPMDQADDRIFCQSCESDHTSRTISVFFAPTDSRPSSSASGCACGGACSCASLN